MEENETAGNRVEKYYFFSEQKTMVKNYSYRQYIVLSVIIPLYWGVHRSLIQCIFYPDGKFSIMYSFKIQ